MTVCSAPAQALCGLFACGTLEAGDGIPSPICGEAVCGYSVMGEYFAYPCPTPLQLVGQLPTLFIGQLVGPVPPVGFFLKTFPPDQIISEPLPIPVPAAGEIFKAYVPGYILSSNLPTITAALLLAGYVPVFVGQQWLFLSTCTDLALAPAGSTDLTLTVSGCR